MSTIPILLVVAVVILVVIPITAALYRSWKVPKAWNSLQDKRDLEQEADQEETLPRLAGEIQDKDVEVWIDSDIAAKGQSGPPHKHYTNIEVPLTLGDDSRICLQKQGVGPTIWRTVMTGPGGFDHKSDEVSEGEDPNLEDDAFDNNFEIAGQLSNNLQEALRSPKVRSLLDEILVSSSELHIEEGTLRYSEPGRVSGRDRLKTLVDDIVEFGLVLDDALQTFHGEDQFVSGADEEKADEEEASEDDETDQDPTVTRPPRDGSA